MISGIYQITCRATGKRYVGSSVNVGARWSQHRHSLKRGNHVNQKLQACWSKYGADQFRFEVLEECAPELLMATEQGWLDREKPELNINPNADAPMRALKHRPETIARISATLKGDPRTRYWAGKQQTEETKARRRASLRLACATPEARARLRLARAIQIQGSHK